MNRVGGSDMCYIRYTMQQLSSISEEAFIEALFEHTENKSIEKATEKEKDKIDSWIDCLLFLKKHMIQYGAKNIDDVSVCFEYKIFDSTWIDAIIVCQDKLIILEFKSGKDSSEEILDGHRSQLIGYYNKITRCNRVIWEEMKKNPFFQVEKYLVYTNQDMIGKAGDLEYILVCDDFTRVLDSITKPANDERVTELLCFKEKLDITTTGVMRDILHRNVLSRMYIQDDHVTACAKIVDQIQNQQGSNLNLIFIKGAPGTGKTGTAFALLEKYMDKGAKYVTGNGNLAQIFQQMIREDKIKGTEAAAVGSLHDLYDVSTFCHKYMRTKENVPVQSVQNRILIIDEAQRVWNPIQIALAKKNKLNDHQKAFIIKHNVSEAMLVIREVAQAIYKDQQSRTIVFLMGSGQEIYIGEENSEKYIYDAVKHLKGLPLKKNLRIHMYVPSKELYDQYSCVSDYCEIEKGLLLKGNKRNAYNDSAIDFVNSIIDDKPIGPYDVKDAFYVYKDYSMMQKAIRPMLTAAFSVGIVANGFETKTEWSNNKYGRAVGTSYLEIDRNKIKNIDNSDLKNFYMDRDSNKLETFASQFNCQGLELDYCIMIWGSQFLRRGNQWVVSNQKISAIDRYCNDLEKLINKYPELKGINIEKEDLRQEFIRNCYRVLMTRARIATYLYVEDQETYEYLKRLIR